MAISFRPVRIGLGYGDSEAVLAFHDDLLIAVLCKLGALHDDKAGWWFVEAAFLPGARGAGDFFADLTDFEVWAAGASLHPVD